MITPEQLIQYAGATGPHVQAQATAAIDEATAYVAAYTRGRHERGGELRPGIEAVIRSVAARILANPAGVSSREQVGPYSYFVGEGFNGFTLGELAVLNRYRRKAIGP